MATNLPAKTLKRANLITPAASKVALANRISKEGVDAMYRETGLPKYKLHKIVRQVANRLEQAKICSVYQPFTSGASKRRARQVGA